ncbi:MAG: hypothetical protein K0S70_1463 [Microbacterium sp.]|nr:hypothetical protein [Microbacterium sp.]
MARATNPRDEYEALSYVIDRVARRFPTVPEDTVIDLVAEEVSSLGGVRLRTYIPVLVEGGVLRRLRMVATRAEAGLQRVS